MNNEIAVAGRVKVRIRQGGRLVCEMPWRNNLILDQGLDKFAVVRFADCFLYCAAGTDNTPVQDVPTATATWSGTVVTASAATWASTDVGKMIVFSTGQQCYITGFTDSTHVNVDRSNTIPAATAFVMYRVNQVKLNAEIARVNQYGANAGDNATTPSGPSITLQRTFIFPEETGIGHTYYELGFSNLGALGGSDLFSRVVLSPGIAVAGPTGPNPGQQLEVVYQLMLLFGPSSPNVLASPQSVTGLPRSYWIAQIQPIVSGFELTINAYAPFFVGDKITISGTSSAYDGTYNVSAITPGVTTTLIDVNANSHGPITGSPPGVGTLTGYISLVQIAQDYAIATVDPSGITTFPAGQILSGEPSQIGALWAADAPYAPANTPGISTPSTSYVQTPYALGAYTGKSFQIAKSGTFPTSQAFNFIAFGLGIPDTLQNQVLRVDCGQRQAKLAGETLTLTFTQSWVRNFF